MDNILLSEKMNTILFDLDETLLDRGSSLRDFVLWQANGMLRNSVSNAQQFCERFVELDSNGAVWKDEVYLQLKQEFQINDWSVDELLESYQLCFCGFSRLKTHALEALHTLKETGYNLGLVSNGKSPFQERNFKALGVSHLFGSIVVSEAVGFRKPAPEIFHLACSALSTTPERTVFVGDNPSADIDGANSVGMYTVYIPGHYGKDCSIANAVCTDFRDLQGIVENAT